MSYSVDRVAWAQRPFLDQMANIGSEVGRTIAAKQAGNDERATQALVRALDLFDATVEQLVRTKSPRLKEVLRAKEQFVAVYTVATGRAATDSLQYFHDFGMAARMHR